MENFFSNAQEGRREKKKNRVSIPEFGYFEGSSILERKWKIRERRREKERGKKKIERRCDRYFCLDSCAKTI